ncbi:ABC transporter substrate-binding protein [Actinopolymorpha alba]|uniref:ABC transporter substrate-binding protein n=1 Tax=Actinopolymorpha alba TaxID=533267 RepID=UPI00035E1BB4|nr:sugar ABC transporter substrate-binding protein [Actinopolymorpha alba]
MTARFRRTVAASALAAIAVLLTACADTTGSTSGEDGTITLTMTWWGNDTRLKNTRAIIDAFEQAHPDITIEPTYSDYSGYWDKLATQTAADDTPDIMQMDEIYLSTYAQQGVLLDLSALKDQFDLSGYPQSAIDSGSVDGTLYALASGAASYAFVANPGLFQKAGVEVPDDTTWTWDDFLALTKQLSEKGGGDYYGFASSFGYDEGSLRLWLREQGETLFDADGKVAASEDAVASFFDYLTQLVKNGSTPPASTLQEGQGVGLSETFLATNRVAVGSFWNSQLSALSDASGSPLQLLMLPESRGSDYLKPSSFWVGSGRTDHPEAVAQFIDFMVNSDEAADIQLTERGIPLNEDVRAHIAPKLSEVDRAAVEYMDGLELGDAEPVTPPNGSQLVPILSRYAEQVVFGKLSPDEAAAGFLRELKDAVANG